MRGPDQALCELADLVATQGGALGDPPPARALVQPEERPDGSADGDRPLGCLARYSRGRPGCRQRVADSGPDCLGIGRRHRVLGRELVKNPHDPERQALLPADVVAPARCQLQAATAQIEAQDGAQLTAPLLNRAEGQMRLLAAREQPDRRPDRPRELRDDLGAVACLAKGLRGDRDQ